MAAGLVNNTIGFIIQARMQSVRLPGKILMSLPLEGHETLLDKIVKKIQQVDIEKELIIATSTNRENDILEKFCTEKKIDIFRGSEEDVLSRFITITKKKRFAHIVRITADNPFIDIMSLQLTINNHISSGADYTYTSGLPLGMNFEIIKSAALLQLENEILDANDKEHVTMFFKKNAKYSINLLELNKTKLKNLRLTVDYASDFMLASSLCEIQNRTNIHDDIALIEYCLSQYPWLFEVNNENIQKVSFNRVTDEIEFGKQLLEKYELHHVLRLLKNTLSEKN